ASSAKASMAGGDTCSGKAFVSQCATETPCGDTSRQKALRYQQTARSVLNRGGALPTPSCAVTYDSTNDTVGDRCTAGFQSLPFALKTNMGEFASISPAQVARLSCGAVVCIAHDGEPGEFDRGA